jgi:hypothetical protein
MRFDKKRYEQSILDYAVTGIYTCPYHAMSFTKGNHFPIENLRLICPPYSNELYWMNAAAADKRNKRKKPEPNKRKTLQQGIKDIVVANGEINKFLRQNNAGITVKIISFPSEFKYKKVIPGRDNRGELKYLITLPHLLDGNNWNINYNIDLHDEDIRGPSKVTVWCTSEVYSPNMQSDVEFNNGTVSEDQKTYDYMLDQWEQLFDVEVRGIKPPIVVRGFEDDSW